MSSSFHEIRQKTDVYPSFSFGYVLSSIAILFSIYAWILSYENAEFSLSSHISRQLASNDTSSSVENTTNQTYIPTTQLVANISVFGAMIMSSYGQHFKQEALGIVKGSKEDLELALERSRREEIFKNRLTHATSVISRLPFPVTHWPPMFAQPCPHSYNQHKTERGVVLAHMQIWMDFVFFDSTTMEQDGPTGTSYRTDATGAKYKDNLRYTDNDIIAIFEDDADIAIPDIHQALIQEFKEMNTDLLFLGWCNGRLANPVPLCAHAYAITRLGAKKLLQYVEPCGAALDEQLVILAKNKWITYRSAKVSGLNYIAPYNTGRTGFKGMFHQKKMGSLNGHPNTGFQPVA